MARVLHGQDDLSAWRLRDGYCYDLLVRKPFGYEDAAMEDLSEEQELPSLMYQEDSEAFENWEALET